MCDHSNIELDFIKMKIKKFIEKQFVDNSIRLKEGATIVSNIFGETMLFAIKRSDPKMVDEVMTELGKRLLS